MFTLFEKYDTIILINNSKQIINLNKNKNKYFLINWNMFNWLINWLFWNWNNYDWIESNYYNDIHKYLTQAEIEQIINRFKKWLSHYIDKQKIVNWEKLQIRIKFLHKQTNSWCISVLITVTNHYKKKRKSFHWIFREKCWNLHNYWVYEYKHSWKNSIWFDEYIQDKKEKCFNWHWSTKNKCR